MSGSESAHGRAGGGNAVGVVARLLVAFDYITAKFPAEVLQGTLQKAGFARAGRADQVEGENIFGFQEAAVALGQQVVLLQNVLFQLDDGLAVVVPVLVLMVAVVVVPIVAVGMRMVMMAMFMLVMVMMAMAVFVGMFMAVLLFPDQGDGDGVRRLVASTGAAHDNWF